MSTDGFGERMAPDRLLRDVARFAGSLRDRGEEGSEVVATFLLYACSALVISESPQADIDYAFKEALATARTLRAAGKLVEARRGH